MTPRDHTRAPRPLNVALAATVWFGDRSHRTQGGGMKGVIAIAGLAMLIGVTGVVRAEDTVNMTIVNVEYEGSKIWVPSTIVAKKGAKVTLKLINNVPSEPNQHGFAIPAYNVAEVVTRGEPKTVEFTASKEGVFPTNCQLHPGHVGGQLVVLP
jgi:nitrosocyanin